MTGTHNKAAIINKWWGGIIASIIVLFAAGSFSFAWNSNSQQASMKTSIGTVEAQISTIQESKLPERMASIEAGVKSTNDKVDDIKEMQRDSNRKLDMLVQGQIDDRRIELRPSR